MDAEDEARVWYAVVARSWFVEACEAARLGGFKDGGEAAFLSSRRGGSAPPKNTRARTDPPSSIGVNMF